MAVKDIKWSYMPVTGYDITGAFNSAKDGVNTSLDYLEKYMDVKTEIATGEAQNALAQAEDALTVNTILQEAMGNSWVDNSALGESGTKKKDTFFDQDMENQKLDELLLNNAHGRGMREKEFGLSSARLASDIHNQDRRFGLDSKRLDMEYRRDMNNEYYKDLDYGYKDQERAEDSEYNKARTNKLNVESANILGGGSSKGTKSKDVKPISLQDTFYMLNDGGKTEDMYNSILLSASSSNKPEDVAIARNALVNMLNSNPNVDMGTSLKEFDKEAHSRRADINGNKTSLSVSSDYRDALGEIQNSISNKDWKQTYSSMFDTMLTVSASIGESSENLSNFTTSFDRFIKDDKNSNEGSAIFDILQSMISKLPNARAIEEDVLNDRYTYQATVTVDKVDRQKTAFRTKKDLLEAMKKLESYLK